MPYAKPHTRQELLGTLRRLAGYGADSVDHDRAWTALRTMVRAER